VRVGNHPVVIAPACITSNEKCGICQMNQRRRAPRGEDRRWNRRLDPPDGGRQSPDQCAGTRANAVTRLSGVYTPLYQTTATRPSRRLGATAPGEQHPPATPSPWPGSPLAGRDLARRHRPHPGALHACVRLTLLNLVSADAATPGGTRRWRWPAGGRSSSPTPGTVGRGHGRQRGNGQLEQPSHVLEGQCCHAIT